MAAVGSLIPFRPPVGPADVATPSKAATPSDDLGQALTDPNITDLRERAQEALARILALEPNTPQYDAELERINAEFRPLGPTNRGSINFAKLITGESGAAVTPAAPKSERPLPGPAATQPLPGPAATQPIGPPSAISPRGPAGVERALPKLGQVAKQLPIEVTPPKTPEEEQSLIQKWEVFLARPEVQAGLLQFAINVLQPVPAGQSPIGAVARAAGGGLAAVGRVGVQRKEEEKLRREEALEERRVVATEKTAEAAVARARKPSEFERKLAVLAGLTGEDIGTLAKRLAFGKEETTEFLTTLKALEALGPGGTATSRGQLLQKRLDKLLSDSSAGFLIRFDPITGKPTIIAQGTSQGLGTILTAQQALGEAQRADSLARNVSLLDTIITALKKDPSRAGIIGSMRRGVQEAVGMATVDLGNAIESLTGIDIASSASQVGKALEALGLADEFEGSFDPQLSKTQLFENTLAADLAILRLTRTGASIRALRQLFLDAKDDVRITGIISSSAVIARFEEIRQEFANELVALAQRNQPGVSFGLEAEELNQRVDEILFGTGAQ